MNRAVIFDFNGVIADDETPHLVCFQQALEEHGLSITREEYYGTYLGWTSVPARPLCLLCGKVTARGDRFRPSLVETCNYLGSTRSRTDHRCFAAWSNS